MSALRENPEHWATTGQVVWDDALGIAFIKPKRRGEMWVAYTRQGDAYMPTEHKGRRLEVVRDSVCNEIGLSIENHVRALHPYAGYTHLIVSFGSHACGVDYSTFKSSHRIEDTTCPMCIALYANRVTARAAEIVTPEIAAEAQAIIEYNKLSVLASGEKATEHDI